MIYQQHSFIVNIVTHFTNRLKNHPLTMFLNWFILVDRAPPTTPQILCVRIYDGSTQCGVYQTVAQNTVKYWIHMLWFYE